MQGNQYWKNQTGNWSGRYNCTQNNQSRGDLCFLLLTYKQGYLKVQDSNSKDMFTIIALFLVQTK